MLNNDSTKCFKVFFTVILEIFFIIQALDMLKMFSKITLKRIPILKNIFEKKMIFDQI